MEINTATITNNQTLGWVTADGVAHSTPKCAAERQPFGHLTIISPDATRCIKCGGRDTFPSLTIENIGRVVVRDFHHRITQGQDRITTQTIISATSRRLIDSL